MRSICILILGLIQSKKTASFVGTPTARPKTALTSAVEESVAVGTTAATSTTATDDLVPVPKGLALSEDPRDRLRDFLDGLSPTPERGRLHDQYVQESGGVWLTQILGQDAYAVSALLPERTLELAQAEAAGHLDSEWPQATQDLLGKYSLPISELTSPAYAQSRKVFAEALSIPALLKNASMTSMQQVMDQAVADWEVAAEKGRVLTLNDEFASITYKVISQSLFGGDLTEQEGRKLRRLTDTMARAIFSVPTQNPILSRLPFFRRYRLAMQAREELSSIIMKIMDRRRRILKDDPQAGTGIIDALIQTSCMPAEETVAFIRDNVITALFAGFDTTAATLTNTMIVLKEDPDALRLLRKELASFDLSTAPRNQKLLDQLPVLQSVVLESFRLRPAVGATFRRTKQPVRVGKVEIPAGASLMWVQVAGMRSVQAYGDDPTKACPLRFLTNSNAPKPNMFGYGKHACPGKSLAQLEFYLILKEFLIRYEYMPLPNQDVSPTIPFFSPKSGYKVRIKKR